jgi:hypothetical protein
MYWTLQNFKDSENKQSILHYGSIFSATTVPTQFLTIAACAMEGRATTRTVPHNCSMHHGRVSHYPHSSSQLQHAPWKDQSHYPHSSSQLQHAMRHGRQERVKSKHAFQECTVSVSQQSPQHTQMEWGKSDKYGGGRGHTGQASRCPTQVTFL